MKYEFGDILLIQGEKKERIFFKKPDASFLRKSALKFYLTL